MLGNLYTSTKADFKHFDIYICIIAIGMIIITISSIIILSLYVVVIMMIMIKVANLGKDNVVIMIKVTNV